MAKNKQSNLIASVKMLNIGFINKHIINLGIGGGGLLSISQLLITCLKIFSFGPPSQLFFSIKYKRFRLCEFFLPIQFYDLPACKQEN